VSVPDFDLRQTYDGAYLWEPLMRAISSRRWPERRVFDLGCGTGATCRMLTQLGFDAIGVDICGPDLAIAQKNGVKAFIGNAYDDLAARYGMFPLVVCLEVIEHCTNPHALMRTFLSLIAPGGMGFLSTPYHGYLKNLLLAASGQMDKHFTALWDGGHVKFFSIKTLRQLFEEAGAANVKFSRVGRIPPLAKSIAAIVTK
jgi:2-polyprenyl-6-hydroxyphenyl methylase/3-demethylubiquinone-9 3-methyltransferase